jgi:hypothetical protein
MHVFSVVSRPVQRYLKGVGKTYLFECPLCQYRVKVCGGAASGRHCEVQTVSCRDCRELRDVFTRVRRRVGAREDGKFPGFFRPEIPPSVLNDEKLGKLVWKDFEPMCPVDEKHVVESWCDPGRCPRCGSYLEKNGFPFRVWD